MIRGTGIIMSGDHPKLILDGIKTMTRRVIKPQPKYDEHYIGGWYLEHRRSTTAIEIFNKGLMQGCCPYGQAGDRLWVRESWSVSDGTLTQYYIYKADGQPHPDVVDSAGHRSKGKWRPSIFMPRWASRITLEITDIRAERVQEIDSRLADLAVAEYMREGLDLPIGMMLGQPYWLRKDLLRRKFIELWDSLNAKHGWEVNPWVWVITFKVIK